MRSLDFSYERSVGKFFAAGVGATSYCGIDNNLNLEFADRYSNYNINFEINPFARLYIHGTKNRSLFVEFFGSYNETKASGGIVRRDNVGYGGYHFGT